MNLACVSYCIQLVETCSFAEKNVGPAGRAQTVRGAGEVDVNDIAWMVRLQ
jgi:hypothetical protein